MTTSLQSQLGTITEASGYGGGPAVVAVSHFFQYTKFDFKPKQYDEDGEGLRSSGFVELASQARTAPQGGEASVEFEWMTKGMPFWLQPLLGAVASSGPGDSAYTHSGTIANTFGYSFEMQVNVPLFPSSTDQPFTFFGCKVASWELGCDVDKKVMFSGKIDVQSCNTGVSLASASYPANSAPYVWADVGITIASTAVPCHSFKLKVDNGMNADRYKLNASALKQEPTLKKRPKVSLEIDPDFTDMTQWNRVRAVLAASKFATVQITMTPVDTGLTIGAATQPTTVATISKLKFMDIAGIGKSPTDGDVVTKLSGEAREDGTNSALQLTVRSTDSTP